MSDFDKEAEREKLREKYERDKEDRKATQRMSDLLLKGATMTNTHCGVCGDPFFQQDGVTFCPSCHGRPEAVEGTTPDGVPSDAAGGDVPDADQETAEPPAENAATSSTDTETQLDTVADDRTHRERPRTQADDTATPDETTATSPRSLESDHDPQTTGPTWDGVRTPPSQATGGSENDPSGGSREPGSSEPSREFDAPSSAPLQGDGLENAHTALTQALEHFAREAATTNDPRYAKECLEAAREAAETLAVLR